MRTKLKELRRRAGYATAEAFAEAVGMSVHTYRRYESGSINLYLDTACDLCDALGCTLDELAGRGEPKRSERVDAMMYAYINLDERGKQAVEAVAQSLSVKERGGVSERVA